MLNVYLMIWFSCLKIKKEISRCYELVHRLGRGVVYLGSSRMGPDHPHYLQALELGREVISILVLLVHVPIYFYRAYINYWPSPFSRNTLDEISTMSFDEFTCVFCRLQIFWTAHHGLGLVQASWMLLLKAHSKQESLLVDLR